MAYTPTTDFIALLRETGVGVYKPERMPGLDFVIIALGRAGLITLVTSDTAPVANQDITAWLDPANPSYGEEGEVKLWNGSTYVAATMRLFAIMLAMSGGLSTTGWHHGTGVPANPLGEDDDFYIRTDTPGGIYGPRAVGTWPVAPIIGTTFQLNVGAGEPAVGVGSNTDWYGRTDGVGGIYYKDAGVWKLLPGSTDNVHTGVGIPAVALGSNGDIYVRQDSPGGIYYKAAGVWVLAPGTFEGADFIIAAGVPAVGIGNNGNLYFRTDMPGGIYYKSGGVWVLLPGTFDKGGNHFFDTGVPDVGVGANGDIFFRQDSPGGIYYKDAGVWVLIPGTDVTSGAAQIIGTGVPAVGVGVNGDWFARMDGAGGIYTKAAGVWTVVPGTVSAGAATAAGGVCIFSAEFDTAAGTPVNLAVGGTMSWASPGAMPAITFSTAASDANYRVVVGGVVYGQTIAFNTDTTGFENTITKNTAGFTLAASLVTITAVDSSAGAIAVFA